MDLDKITQKYAGLQDPGIREFMIAGERFYPPNAVDFTLAEQRAFYDAYCKQYARPYPEGLETEDFKVDHIPCRRYRPARIENSATLLYLHGGGFILGGLESHDAICADLAHQTGCETIAVEYRLAPEHKFPAAFDDCRAVLQTIKGPVIVAGDSAGGNLSAALSIDARDRGDTKIIAQVLFYPGLGGDMSKGSYITQANAPGLTTSDVQYYHNTYGGGHHKLASPLQETNYKNLPPAFVIAAALDPLHDDGVDYVNRLNAAGVKATLRSEPLLVHAFLRARYMSKPAAESFAAAVAAIRSFAA